MAHSMEDVEERIQLAIKAFNNNEYTTFKKATLHFNAPYKPAVQRHADIQPKANNGGLNRRLSDSQEEALYKFIDRLNTSGFPLPHDIICLYTNYLSTTSL
jgi:hypothetical protein